MKLLRGLLGLLVAVPAFAASTEPFSLLGISTGKSGSTVSVPMQIVIMMTLMTLLPAAVMSITPFLRITIVLHFLRQALGTQSTPSNQVLLGLALFLTIIIMQPVAADMYHQGWEPLEAGQLTTQQAMDQGAQPLRNFLIRFARDKDIRLFVEIAHAPLPHNAADLDLKVLIPAYILSELKTGFQIGAVLFLPFLVIDLVVASVTLSV
jgi:flagellar biosynthetic protein FliP